MPKYSCKQNTPKQALLFAAEYSEFLAFSMGISEKDA